MTDFRVKGKKVIGLSGSIASGKSAAADIFRHLGADVVSADELSSKFYLAMLPQIEKHFNTQDKKAVAAAVFADENERKWLESLLHPLVFDEAFKIIKKSKKQIVVFDVPLLFETGLKNSFDLTLCICASYDIRLKRAIKRGMEEADFKRRDFSQMPQKEKIKLADYCFYNDKTPKDLEVKIKKFYCDMLK